MRCMTITRRQTPISEVIKMKKYETAEMEIIKFDAEDVITTSGDNSGDITLPEHEFD